MGTQLVLSFAKRLFFNLCNALNSKPNSQTIRILAPYCNISLFSLVFILKYKSLKSSVQRVQVYISVMFFLMQTLASTCF